MKRKIIIPILTAFAMLSANAYAATPSYNSTKNSVEYNTESAYQTVLITKQDTADIVYIGQKDDGYNTAQEFLIKSNPVDGMYVLKTGGFDNTVTSETFSIAAYYNVTATIDPHIETVSLKPSNDPDAEPYSGDINRETNTATFSVPKGTYIISYKCDNEYELKETPSQVQVNGETIEPLFTLTTKQTEYTVTGEIDDHVESVTLTPKNGGEPIEGTIEDGTVTFKVVKGTYTLSATAAAHYRLKTTLPVEVEIDKTHITLDTIETEEDKYPVTIKTDGHIASVIIKKDTKTIETISSFTSNEASCSLEIGDYTIVATPIDEYKLPEGAPTTLNVTKDGTNEVTLSAVQIKYDVTVTVDANVASVTLNPVSGGSAVTQTNDGGTSVAFSIPAGEYAVSATYEPGYHGKVLQLDNVTINKTNKDFPYQIKSEEDTVPRYDVTINVDGHIDSVNIKRGDTVVQPITSFPNNTLSFTLEAGKYTMEVTPASGYKLKDGSSQEFTVTTSGATVNIETEEIKHTVTVNVGSNVKSVTLTPTSGQAKTENTNGSTSVTFSVPAGTYTISAEAVDGYHITTNLTEASITVNDTMTFDTTIEAAVNTYSVTITTDGNIASAVIKKGVDPVETIDGFTNNTYSCKLEVGEYTIEATAADEYELAENSKGFEVTVNGAQVELSATPILYTVTVASYENVASITLTDANDSTKTYTKSADELSDGFSVPAGEYTVVAEPAGGFKIDACTQSVTVNKDHTTDSISVTTSVQEEQVYSVSGTVDANVLSVTIKKVGVEPTIVAVITEFGEDGSFSCNQLEAGEYIIEIATKDDDFELGSITDDGNFTITGSDVTGIVITTKEKIPEIPVTRTKVTTENNETVLTTRLFNITCERTCIVAAYGDGGKLIAIQLDTTQDGSVSFRFPSDENIKSFKVLVWNSVQKMKPMTSAEPVK